MEAGSSIDRTIGSCHLLVRLAAPLALFLVAGLALLGCPRKVEQPPASDANGPPVAKAGAKPALPPGFDAAFTLPDADKDQHGNPVVERKGSRTDPETGCVYEIWLKNPRMEFVLIPAGDFDSGSPDSEEGREEHEGPVQRVRIAKPFYLAKYEVTQAQWESVMKNNPSNFQNAGKDAPAENVSWDDCQVFLKELNNHAGAAGEGQMSRFSLPSEAEWEYACRAGARTALYTGPLTIRGDRNGPELDPIAWYGGNSGVTYAGGWDTSKWTGKQNNHSHAGTHPVGKKKPNAWGFYDMLGGIAEWCADNWHDRCGAGHTGNNALSRSRVIRGGSWYARAQRCRCAYRNAFDPDHRRFDFGLRLACLTE